jgi:hypothetical protein
VLGDQQWHQGRRFAAGLHHLREDVALLQLLLVVGLAETAKELGRAPDLLAVDAGEVGAHEGGALAEHHQDSPQHPVLAHQVLGG